jgi:MFS family permease
LAVGGEALSATAFSVLGLAIAGVAPTVLAVARARPTDERAAVVNAMVATTYLGFVVTPPTVGWLAELFGLQPTLLLVLAALLVAMRCLAGAIEPHR